jgi:hypothetical protein
MGPRIIIALLLALLIAGGNAWQEIRIAAAKTTAVTAESARDVALAAQGVAEAKVRSAQVTNAVVTQYVDRVQLVHVAGATITREIPIYVTASADAACPIPSGFVHIHNAAAEGRAAGQTTGDPDAPAAGLALSDVADTIVDNYTSCHAVAEQLIALQAWVAAHTTVPEKSL